MVLIYTNIEEAIHFVFKAFHNINRRREEIGAAFHSISVGFMLKEIGCNEKTIIAGLLHDIIEDTIYTYEDIKELFGQDIADIVKQVSEDYNLIDWKERKEELVGRLENASLEILLIEAADKLQNLLTDYHLFEKGKKIYYNFDDVKWYYCAIYEILIKNFDNDLTNRYKSLISMYFDYK